MRFFTLLPLACLLAPPALAIEAITYKGTLGGTAIVLELSDPAAAPVVGRYSYMKVGGDIPLQAGQETGEGIALSEEAPCAPGLCAEDAGSLGNPPIGARWALRQTADGLTGTWTSARNGKALPIMLERLDNRTLPADTEITPAGLRDSAVALTYGTALRPLDGSPYDRAKMAVAYEAGPIQTIEGSRFRHVSDPRTRFAFPRVVELADGSSPDPINAALTAAHSRINFNAFDCLAMAYAGFGASDQRLGGGQGTLGDYDGENVELRYLSPTVIDWTESGSTFCGGAYPNNHSTNFIFDVRTGTPLALASVFSDWRASQNLNDYSAPVDQAAARANPQDYAWEAGQPLIDYVRANRPADDTERDEECGIDDLIGSNLGVRFEPGDTAVFMLEGLPHAIFACSDDLLSVPLADMPQLLAPSAASYFPALAD